MYKLSKNTGFVIRLSDNASIPMDKENNDYIEYLDWLNQGNIPSPAQTSQELRSDRIADIKSRSNTDIAALISTDDQLVKISRILELALKKMDGGVITPPERAEINETVVIWSGIRAVKQREATEIANLPADLR